ncbi:MAG: ATP-binding cassette domain-containing protein [Rhodospirillales bacterium]|jgi:ATP-binding cassette subfamily C protein LapB|nr:ATP-binding cassette domain-containing protein [Rhodospirillales bacterium]
MALSLFVNLMALAVPVFTMQVYDRVVFQGGISTLHGLLIGMIGVLGFDYVLRTSRGRIMQTVALRVDVHIGRALFEKLMSLPLQTLEAKPAAYWQALFRDVDAVRNTLSGASAVLMADLPFVFVFLALIFVIAKPLGWVLLIILPFFLFVAWRSGASMADANKDERESTQGRDGLMAEIIAGRSTIKALALDRAMRPLWEEKHADNIENSIKRGGRADLYTNMGASLAMITTLTLTAIGAIAILEGQLTMGSLIATNMLSGRLIGPLNQLVGTWRTYAGFKQSVERLGTVFDSTSERQESAVSLGRPKGKIAVEEVSYTYLPDIPPVVDNVSLDFEEGRVHALVGRNGSGKSTLLKLIQGLYAPDEGRVLLDDADITQFTRAELADWMGYVPQDCILFEGSVRENIAHRKPHADDEEVIKAATDAGVHQFIIDMPDGYASDIGEAGRRLSGGQRQRIAIARALVGDPPILLLDEPSASLDRQAEQELRRTLKAISRERTIFMVTHSPLLLAIADNLIALDHGKIALAGPAAEILPKLLSKPGAKRTAPPDAKAPGQAKTPEEAKSPGKPRTPETRVGLVKPRASAAPGDSAKKKPAPKAAARASPEPGPPGCLNKGPRARPRRTHRTTNRIEARRRRKVKPTPARRTMGRRPRRWHNGMIHRRRMIDGSARYSCRKASPADVAHDRLAGDDTARRPHRLGPLRPARRGVRGHRRRGAPGQGQGDPAPGRRDH